MTNRKRIAVDMDGVLADIERHYIDWYEQAYGLRIPQADLVGFPEGTGFPDREATARFLRTAGFFRTAPVMVGAQQALQELQATFDIYIVSAAMEFPLSLTEKREWLAEHFPFIDWRHIVFCGDKSIIHADFMIDDHVKNLDYFEGTTLLFNAAHNDQVKHHRRVHSWQEISEFFRAASLPDLPAA